MPPARMLTALLPTDERAVAASRPCRWVWVRQALVPFAVGLLLLGTVRSEPDDATVGGGAAAALRIKHLQRYPFAPLRIKHLQRYPFAPLRIKHLQRYPEPSHHTTSSSEAQACCP
eukprot:SAG31_NODE_257_length_18942_cov_6.099135_7_plen_116_part_00